MRLNNLHGVQLRQRSRRRGSCDTCEAPVNWVTALVFTITPLIALLAVPWYGFVNGYSLGAWLLFVFLLAVTGMSITSGYHRLWAHRTYQAH